MAARAMEARSLPHSDAKLPLAGAIPWAAGVVLAGGRSRRMGGGDKSLIPLAGIPLIAHALARLAPQVSPLAISANGDPARFAACAVPVLPDTVKGYAGPLAGILAGMLWARTSAPHATHILTVAADTPFFPLDLGVRLAGAIDDKRAVAVASSNGQPHHIFALWPVSFAETLAQWLDSGEQRSVHAWLAGHRYCAVDFSGTPAEPFFNINTPHDLEIARRLFEGNAL